MPSLHSRPTSQVELSTQSQPKPPQPPSVVSVVVVASVVLPESDEPLSSVEVSTSSLAVSMVVKLVPRSSSESTVGQAVVPRITAIAARK